MKALTLEDFKKDYQHLVIRYDSKRMECCRVLAANALIKEHYSHIADACTAYVNSKEPEFDE